MDSLESECALFGAGGQRCGDAAALALGDGGTIVGARGGGSDCVDHERAVFAGGSGFLSVSLFLWKYLSIILVSGRLYTLAHGIR